LLRRRVSNLLDVVLNVSEREFRVQSGHDRIVERAQCPDMTHCGGIERDLVVVGREGEVGART
jgi:hypothetical protein